MTTLLERLAARVPEFGVRLAYGAPASVGGEEMLPVALVSYGFGAGEGTDGDAEPEMSGSGGGGGGLAVPVGVYVRRHGRVVFRPNAVALLACAAPVILALGAGVAAIVRAAR